MKVLIKTLAKLWPPKLSFLKFPSTSLGSLQGSNRIVSFSVSYRAGVAHAMGNRVRVFMFIFHFPPIGCWSDVDCLVNSRNSLLPQPVHLFSHISSCPLRPVSSTMSTKHPVPSSRPSSEAASAIKSADKDAVMNVRRSFRSFASSLIVAARQAEKVAATKSSGSDTVADKSLEEAVQMILKQRQAVRRTATLLEGTLRGNISQSEALHCCLRSQPCVGGRKRKFTLINPDDAGKEAT